MPDRQYTYTVEIDAASTRQAAQQLRAIFERELADITAKTSTRAAPDNAMRSTQQAAAATRQSFEQLARVDLTAGTDALRSQLQLLKIELDQAIGKYEEMTRLASAGGGVDRRRAAQMQTYAEEVAKAAGDDAGRAVRNSGRALNIGQRGAEFKSDEAGYYLEAERDYYASGIDNTDKRRFTIAERQALIAQEAELVERQLAVTRVEKALNEHQLAGLEQQIEAAMQAQRTDEANRLDTEIMQVDRSLADLAESEAQYMAQLESAHKRLADAADEAAAKAQRDARAEMARSGQIVSAGPAGTAAGTYSQTVLTVRSKDVDNAEKLAANMREAAEAAERQAAALQNASRREWELDTIRQRSKIEHGTRINAEAEIERERTAQTQLRAEIARTTNVQKAESAERVEAAKGEARARVELAKGEARAVAEAAEAATAQIKAEENRRTAIVKAELKERERATATSARQQSQAQGPSALSRPFGMSWGQLATGAAATVGIYGIDQVARGMFDAGREGAQQMRQMETFEALAQRVGVSSAAVVRAIRDASQETITSTNAMGLAAQVLSQKFAATSTNITGELETLVAFSRRASQIYTDETGAFLSTQDVFSRLIKFAREGNKELVDQFGLSNQAIAAQLGTTVSGLAGATGAADRWRGMILLLDDELKRLGQASASTADKFEADTARIEESWNRIKRALAEPVGAVVTYAADSLEAAQVRTGTVDTDTMRGTIEDSIEAWQKIGKAPPAGFEILLKTFEQLEAATIKNAEAARFYEEELRKLAQDAYNMGFATKDQIERTEELRKSLELIAQAQDSYSAIMAGTTQEAIEQNAAILNLATGIGQYENMYTTGQITLLEYIRITDALTESLRVLTEAAGLAGSAVSMVQFNVPTMGQRANAIMGPNPAVSFAIQQQQSAWDQARIDAQTERDAGVREERKRAEEAAAKKAASEWESAAKKTQAAFEAAAQSAAGEFKSALEAVPGLFGTSSVTAEDMALAAVGGYQDKADERLRVLADEVLNKKDTPEDPADWARRMGLDPSTDPRRVLAEAQARWADSSLFAGGANLDLLNRDAIAAALARGDASKAGKNALLAEFGLGEDSPLDAAGKGALQEMLGLGEQELTAAGGEARAAFDAGFYAPAAAGAASATGKETAGMAATLAQQLKTDIEAGEIADALYSIGGSILGRIHAGYEAAAANADWSDALIASLAADVAPIVIEAIADQLPPKT